MPAAVHAVNDGSVRSQDSSEDKSRRVRYEHVGDPTSWGKGDPQVLDGKGEDVIPLYRGWRQPLLYFDWLWRPWVYWDTPVHFVAWYTCVGFYFGALCFIVGTFTSITTWIYNTEVYGNCMSDTYDWTTNVTPSLPCLPLLAGPRMLAFTFMLGNILWQPAVIMQVMEAQNHDWEAKYEDWYKGGKLGTPPRYRWIAFHWWSLEWWGGMQYTIGVVGYNMAAITAVIYDCDEFSDDTYTGLTTYVYMGSGILFLGAGAFYNMHFLSIWLFPSTFVPLRRRDWSSLFWWALWMYFWGGVGFCMTGIYYYWISPINFVASYVSFQWVQGIGFGVGAMLFHFGALLLLMRQSRGRCRPSYQMVHERFDPTGRRADRGETEKAGLPNGFTKVDAHYPKELVSGQPA